MARKKRKRDDFWASVERSAASVRDLPAWQKIGLVVDCEHFIGPCICGGQRCKDK